jgi:hypothetical protein
MRKSTLLLLLTLFFISSANALERSTIYITRSLAYDAQKMGINQKTINNIVRIFSWSIDFNRDLKRGDRFIIIGKRRTAPSALIYIGKKKRVSVPIALPPCLSASNACLKQANLSKSGA